MNIKWIGAVLVIVGCGGFGFLQAAGFRREMVMLEQLMRLIQHMTAELKYRLTPLPELCGKVARESSGEVKNVFHGLAKELDRQLSPEVYSCMITVLDKHRDKLPASVRKLLRLLGRTLGRYDSEGQLKGLDSVCTACRHELELLEKSRDVRLKNYQTLGFCAGTAIVILFI